MPLKVKQNKRKISLNVQTYRMPTSKLATSVYVAPKVNDHEWSQVRDQDYQAEVNQADA